MGVVGGDDVMRSAIQESAVIMSLQMFHIILQTTNSHLQNHLLNNNHHLTLPKTANILLPAIKVTHHLILPTLISHTFFYVLYAWFSVWGGLVVTQLPAL